MTDEEYVLANWERAELCENRARAAFCISLGGREFTRASIPERVVDSAKLAWSAAAEFTRERLKQISEVEEEIGWMEADVDHCTERGSSELVPYRTLMRLEGIRNDLLRGMKNPSAVQCAVNSPYVANSDQIVSDSPDDAALRRDQEGAPCVKPAQGGTIL